LKKRTAFFEKKETKKLLLLRWDDPAWTPFSLRVRQRAKVFWFFFSKNNAASFSF
jgi:hypothetical protein